MEIKNIRIVFMGTPEFAVSTLSALVEAGCQIAGVVTAPDKPAGRGMKLQESAVKKYAMQKGLPILQPQKLKSPEFLSELKSLHADLQVVVAFRMLPELVWNMPPMGTINLHASLLPDYRGAAPINWAVINGESFTGVTTFRLQHEIDTGPILLQKKIGIEAGETAGHLHDRMKGIGAALVLETLKGLVAGNLKEVPQQIKAGAKIKMAPKIFSETCHIQWNQPVEDILNLVRGLSPFPAAFTELDGKKLKIFNAETEHTIVDIPIGHYKTDHRSYLKYAGTDGYLELADIQLEGKKKMKTADFLRGYRFNIQPLP
jgi:methionyl-tRNA formyltransferase